MRERISERNAALWQDPEYRATVIARLRASWERRGGRSDDERARIGERSRRMWSDPAFKARMGRAMSMGWANRRERLVATSAKPMGSPISVWRRSHGPDVPLQESDGD
jgi:hypothetical protein